MNACKCGRYPVQMHLDSCTAAVLEVTWCEVSRRHGIMTSGATETPLMFPAYNPEFLPPHRITRRAHVCFKAAHKSTQYFPTHTHTCAYRLRDSTLGVHQCTN